MSRLRVGQFGVSATPQVVDEAGDNEYGFLMIKPLSANASSVFIGSDDELTDENGYELRPGEELRLIHTNKSGAIPMDVRPDQIYVVGADGDRVSWVATQR